MPPLKEVPRRAKPGLARFSRCGARLIPVVIACTNGKPWSKSVRHRARKYRQRVGPLRRPLGRSEACAALAEILSAGRSVLVAVGDLPKQNETADSPRKGIGGHVTPHSGRRRGRHA